MPDYGRLKNKVFETVSIACKVGSVPKEEIRVKENEKMFIGEYESMFMLFGRFNFLLIRSRFPFII